MASVGEPENRLLHRIFRVSQYNTGTDFSDLLYQKKSSEIIQNSFFFNVPAQYLNTLQLYRSAIQQAAI